MAILITAPLGTGKTLYTIELIFEYLNQGRPVYSNIVGLKIVGVINVDSTAQSPFDWRDLPNDAVLFFDEAHEHPAFSERDLLKNLTIDEYEQKLKGVDLLDIPETKKKSLIAQIEREYSKALKRKKDEILDIGLSMSMHRHFGQEIVLITQNPTKLNKDILGNVTIHYVMRRKFGFEAANIWTFGEAMTTWGKSVADSALIKKYWRFPKHLYKFYVSSEKHNVKKYFPKKYYAFACIPLLIFYLGYSKAAETGFFGLVPKKAEAAQVMNTPGQKDMGYDAVIIPPDPNDPIQQKLEKAEADSLGLTVEQYRDLKNPELRNAQIVKEQSKYNISDPFDYSYIPEPVAVSHRVFSGCMTDSKGRMKAYDQQGSIIHDANPALCKRVMNGDRPFNAYKQNQTQGQSVTGNAQSVTGNSPASEPQPLDPEFLAKYHEAKRKGLI